MKTLLLSFPSLVLLCACSSDQSMGGETERAASVRQQAAGEKASAQPGGARMSLGGYVSLWAGEAGHDEAARNLVPPAEPGSSGGGAVASAQPRAQPTYVPREHRFRASYMAKVEQMRRDKAAATRPGDLVGPRAGDAAGPRSGDS